MASEFANKGYCSSKGIFFYGVKLHVVGQRKRSAMPVLECAGLTPGSEKPHRSAPGATDLEGGQLYGDKAYCDGAMKRKSSEEQNLEVLTPVKRRKVKSASQRLINCSQKPSAR